jgi:ribonuclease P protein component
MFPKSKRIPRKMFPLLSNGAKTFKNNLFLLRFVSQSVQSSEFSHLDKNYSSRFCFSVSKKVAKNAVMRNKMRRAGYRLLEKYFFEIRPKIIASFSFRKIPKNDEEIVRNLESVLKESKLIK